MTSEQRTSKELASPECPGETFIYEDALHYFEEYFVANYPGPRTIISDPKWHAPKIFRNALYAIRAASHPMPAGDPTVERWCVSCQLGLPKNADGVHVNPFNDMKHPCTASEATQAPSNERLAEALRIMAIAFTKHPEDAQAHGLILKAADRIERLHAALQGLMPEGWDDPDGHMDHMPGVRTARLLLTGAAPETYKSPLHIALQLIRDDQIPQGMSPQLFAEHILRGAVVEADDECNCTKTGGPCTAAETTSSPSVAGRVRAMPSTEGMDTATVGDDPKPCDCPGGIAEHRRNCVYVR